jgi:hypothetical protein
VSGIVMGSASIQLFFRVECSSHILLTRGPFFERNGLDIYDWKFPMSCETRGSRGVDLSGVYQRCSVFI